MMAAAHLQALKGFGANIDSGAVKVAPHDIVPDDTMPIHHQCHLVERQVVVSDVHFHALARIHCHLAVCDGAACTVKKEVVLLKPRWRF